MRKVASIQAKPQSSDRPADGDDLKNRIAQAAYYRAQGRGFAPGGEIDDWLQAEAEVMSAFSTGYEGRSPKGLGQTAEKSAAK